MTFDIRSLGLPAGTSTSSDTAQTLDIDGLSAEFDIDSLPDDQVTSLLSSLTATKPLTLYSKCTFVGEHPDAAIESDDIQPIDLPVTAKVKADINLSVMEPIDTTTAAQPDLKARENVPENSGSAPQELPDIVQVPVEIASINRARPFQDKTSKIAPELPANPTAPEVNPANEPNRNVDTKSVLSVAIPTSPETIKMVKNSLIDTATPNSEDVSKVLPRTIGAEQKSNDLASVLSITPRNLVTERFGLTDNPVESLVFSKGSALTSEVGQRFAPLTQHIPSHQSPTKITEQIVSSVSSASDKNIEIRLDPPELGKVRITLTHSDSGTVAQVVSEKPEISDMLRRNAALLTRELIKAGFESVSLDFQSGGDQRSSHQPTDEDLVTYNAQPENTPSTQNPRSVPVLNTDTLDRRI